MVAEINGSDRSMHISSRVLGRQNYYRYNISNYSSGEIKHSAYPSLVFYQVFWSDEAFPSRYFGIFLQRTHQFYYYLVYCYMFTNFVNRKKLKSNTVGCFKTMVNQKKTWGHGAHDWARSTDQKQKMERDSLSVCLWLSSLPE